MSTITDGAGSGYKAKVGEDNRLQVYSKSASLQHIVSEDLGQAYQIIGISTAASATVTVLHIKNIDPSRIMIVTYIRHQVIGATGGTSFPNASNYFQVGFGTTYVSGGSVATAVNVNAGSGNTALITSYQNSPVVTGTFLEIDRWYTQSDGDMNVFNKEGALIIQPNNTIEIRYVGDRTAGTIYSRISFLMGD